MARVSAEKFVKKGLVAGTFDFECPGVEGSPCGDLLTGGPPYSSRGWPSKPVAADRGDQHLAEHKLGKPMQDIDGFRAKHKLVPKPDGTAVKLEEL